MTSPQWFLLPGALLLMRVLTEVAVLISLFSAGVKMPGAFNFTRWRPTVLLATVSMTLTVALVAAFGVVVLDMPLGAGIFAGRNTGPY
jgi:NhaP-type Na+/H+ or K+/H+ antiporter